MIDRDERVPAFAKTAVLFHRYGISLIGAILVCALTVNTMSDRSPASYYAFFLIAVVGGLVLLNFIVEGRRAEVDREFVAARSRSAREFVIRNRRGVTVSVLLALYGCLIPWLGFYASSTLLLLAGFLCLGIEVKRAIAVSLLILIVGYLVFTSVLNIPLPEGVLF